MLATAKAELLRRENYNEFPHFHTRQPPSASPQLWNAAPGRGSPLASSMTPESEVPSGLENISTLKGGLPRIRSDSVGNLDPRAAHKAAPHEPSLGSGYVSPIPSYALSTSEPIPRGYVAHARDACVDVDYQWDSSRDNLGWGDGGVLPEEWAAMHQRFRKGLRRLIEWYTITENPGDMVTKTASNMKFLKSPQENNHSSLSVSDDEEVEIENVVVLVSHGAGCNALIGAITQQPVLIDVGMSSITMAQRKPEFDDGFDMSIYDKPASSLEEPLITKRTLTSEMFELKLFANTEHLHTTMTPPALSRSSSARNPRGRYNTGGLGSALKEINFGAQLYGPSSPGSRSNSMNASLGSMRRGSPVLPSSFRPPSNGTTSVGLGGISEVSSTRPSRSGSTGLWQPPAQNDAAMEERAGTPPVFDAHHGEEMWKKDDEAIMQTQEQEPNSHAVESLDPITKVISKTESQLSEEHDNFDESAVPRLWAGTGAGSGSGGLWGAPRPPGEAERNRDFTSTKRRWTVTER